MLDFEKRCFSKGISVISKLQSKQTSADYKSDVWLIRDQDGLFKVLKEYVNYNHLPGYLNEPETFLQLSTLTFIPTFIPTFYGITTFEDSKYIRRSFSYGQLLSDYCYKKEKLLNYEEVFYIIFDLSTKLKILQNEFNILLLDLRPENILIHENEIKLFDLGLSRHKDDDKFFKPVVSHPRFTAPEIVIDSKANSKSIIFQLGLIAHELLYGRHPFDINPNDDIEWHSCTERYITNYLRKSEITVENEFIQKMLSYDIEERPLLDDCILEFKQTSKIFIHQKINWKHNSKAVLFPARMGIPHKGHIEFMSTFLNMGFKLIISIQRSYCPSDIDPIPKWLVMKMVAQSLLEKGYPEESFHFYLTPFYETDKEFLMHFTMLPEHFDYVASSNESISRYFPESIIEQKDVLGFERVPYKDRSWGKIIRSAVENDNYSVFEEYAATGVEKILSFEEIRKKYILEKKIDLFIFSKNVFVELYDQNNKLIVSKKVSRYSTPELSLGFPIIDKYSKNSKIKIDDKIYELIYDETTYLEKKCIIKFKIK